MLMMSTLPLGQGHDKSRREGEDRADQGRNEAPAAAIPFLVLGDVILELLFDNGVLLTRLGKLLAKLCQLTIPFATCSMLFAELPLQESRCLALTSGISQLGLEFVRQ